MWAGLGGGGAAALVLTVMGEPLQPKESLQPERVFSPRSPSELIALGKGKTEIAASFAMKPHIGTWLQYQGPVIEVQSHPSKEGMVIILEHSVDEPRIAAWFDPSWSKKIGPLEIGDQVTVTGEIYNMLSPVIFLKKCELV